MTIGVVSGVDGAAHDATPRKDCPLVRLPSDHDERGDQQHQTG